MKIISGGQTGVDRAALDVALKHGIDCGGWCPARRLDELGRIPERYPLREMEQGSFADRTLQNVKDSNGTVVIYFNKPRGGTQFTIECCEQVNRPHLVINAAQTSATEAATAIGDFVREHMIDILNVAGPRQSEWAGGYDYAVAVFEIFAQ
jgi:Circularly permutated YpsA SLOG family